MEGSRHERVVLVIVSYVIGFITAFIAYSVSTSSNEPSQPVFVVYEVANEYDYKKFADESNEATEVFTEVLYQDGRLLVKRGAELLLVSLNPDEAGFPSNALAGEPQGHHVTEPTYELAPDGNKLFFCEQKSTSEDVCSSFILDVQERVVRPVKVAGEPLRITPEEAKEAVWDGNKLALYDLASVDESQPWNLTEMY